MSSALQELMDVVNAAGLERPQHFFADGFALSAWQLASFPKQSVRALYWLSRKAHCGEP